MKRFTCLLVLFALSGCGPAATKLTVFYAPVFSPVIAETKTEVEEKLKVRLAGEVSGSQVACRKVTELGRECDVLFLADAGLFKSLAANHTRWRLEFAHDEIVLGVGIRARRVDEAEANWPGVLLDPKITIGRVNESLGPVGYRTLLVWSLLENQGHARFKQRLLAKTSKTLDHVDHLAALLKNGDLEYGFLYRTTCRQYDIRFIPLAPELNLGTTGQDYSRVSVTYYKTLKGKKTPVTVRGGLITYGVSVPLNAPRPALGRAFITNALRDHAQVFRDKGYQFFTPRFFGTREDYRATAPWAEYGGSF